MTAYYNEIDPYAAQWLRNLISAGHIAPGDVDERSIEDVRPDDIRGYTQCHFFAGIGVWSHALRNAGWSDDRPVWTGSCPCQPFSQAGKGVGFADERHLWPAFHWLIEQCGPPVVFGEQVASKDGLTWLDLVQTDLEAAGYAVGAADLCAAGVGAPHIRQRLFWVADSAGLRRREWEHLGGLEVAAGKESEHEPSQHTYGLVGSGACCGLAHPDDEGLEGREPVRQRADQCAAGSDGVAGRLADANDRSEHTLLRTRTHHSVENVRGSTVVRSGRHMAGRDQGQSGGLRELICSAGPTNGFWRDADWLSCRDARWRPVEPGTFPLAHGAPSRVGRLRAYGNAIVAPLASTFIGAYLDSRQGDQGSCCESESEEEL